MALSVLDDKSKMPDDGMLAEVLGKSKGLWDAILRTCRAVSGRAERVGIRRGQVRLEPATEAQEADHSVPDSGQRRLHRQLRSRREGRRGRRRKHLACGYFRRDSRRPTVRGGQGSVGRSETAERVEAIEKLVEIKMTH